MPAQLLSSTSWSTITAAARRNRRPAYVAVAYLADKAASMLPLARGSVLVVDASDPSVKSGRTCPAELLKMSRRGTRVFSAPNLHAKVFAFSDRAFVGSANASRNSRDNLIEAVISTDDRAIMAAARTFVSDRCLQELGPEALKQLQKLYRPPKLGTPERLRKAPRTRVGLANARIVNLVRSESSSDDEENRNIGHTVARQRMTRPRRHMIDDFYWPGACPFKNGETVVQVVTEADGLSMVERPATVLHVRTWSRSGLERHWVFLERPVGRRVELARLAKRIGSGAKKRLRRGGRLNAAFAEQLLKALGHR